MQSRAQRTTVLTGLLTALMAALLAGLLAGLLVNTVPASAAVVRPLVNADVPDPSIARASAGHYVVVGTGEQVVRLSSTNGRRWRPVGAALVDRPAWAVPIGSIWASDIVHVGRHWVLYYAVPVRGLTGSSRCIGAAVATQPTGRFVPVGAAPLVCPPDADTPRAADPVLDPGRSEPTLPTNGVIDPSLFQGAGGTWLLYKTDGRPSSIRIVPLTGDGLRVAGGSRPLLTSGGIVENPVLLQRGAFFYLFASVGDYTRCSYATVFWRSRSLLDWSGPARTLLSKRQTGLCGPGGADVLVTGRGARARVSLYFHAWVCRGTGRPCAEPFGAWAGQEDARTPVRALYGTTLRFTRRGLPVRGTWIRPHQRAP